MAHFRWAPRLRCTESGPQRYLGWDLPLPSSTLSLCHVLRSQSWSIKRRVVNGSITHSVVRCILKSSAETQPTHQTFKARSPTLHAASSVQATGAPRRGSYILEYRGHGNTSSSDARHCCAVRSASAEALPWAQTARIGPSCCAGPSTQGPSSSLGFFTSLRLQRSLLIALVFFYVLVALIPPSGSRNSYSNIFVTTVIYDDSVAGITGLPAYPTHPNWLVQLYHRP